MTIFTIGHSTRSSEEFIELLRSAGVKRVWDIRSFPGSRKYPHFNTVTLAEQLRAHGIEYEHHRELGGRRRPSAHAAPTAWRNEGFRAYAEYMQTDAFSSALHRLIDAGRHDAIAIMCAEAVPWRCHRHLVSDALLARGVEVRHIMDGKLAPHTLTKFAVVRDGEVAYPPAHESGIPLDLGSR